ncbi:Gfo/Idh/MocA family oxidoreductase [Gammaproteobacteria bacterium]|nr:Gfo/Idh/MocA family oxidoreductase [Gammaproteobacteria bacterium]
MVETIKLGMIGINEGNGHPFSFAAIINGFDDKGMKNSGWDVIYNYLKIRDASEFGFDNVQVTHVWTQDPEQTKKIATASKIHNIVVDVNDMLDEVDGVLIARDDYETHYPLAKTFLENGKFVFIDKPLSLQIPELRFFKKYLDEGKLMSCAGARYAKELDEIRGNIASFGEMKLIRGTVINSMEKYGIHMLDGIFGVTGFQVKSVSCFDAKHTSMMIKNADDSLIYIDALGKSSKTLQFDFWSDEKRFHAETNDNFSMFRRLLADFIKMIRTKKPTVDPELVINSMKVLIAANISRKENREVEINEITI